MADQTVQIENVGGDGVASEVTLERLARAMEKMAGISNKGQKEENKLRELHNKATQSGITVVKKNRDALEENTEAVEDSTNAFNNAARGALGLAVKGFGTLLGSAVGLGKELVMGGDRLTDFAQHIPIVGSHLSILTGFIDSTVDNFRSLTSVGVDFGGSLFEVQAMAARSGLSLETFTNTIRNNSQDLALFGGGAREGAKRFTQISGILQKNFGPQFSNLGLTMEETAEYTADYIKLQTRLGRSQQMTDQQIASGTHAYTMQLDRLAKVTGQQRDAIAAQLEKESLDARMRAVMATMDETARANLTGVTTMLEAASPKTAEAVRELVATGGVPVSEFGKDLIRLNPRLAGMAKGLRDGTVTQDEFMAEMRKTAETANNLTDEQKKQYATMAGLGSEVGSAAIELMGLQNVGKGSADALDAQQKAAKRGNDGLLDFERRITQARNIIVGALIESGVFKSLETMLSDVVNYFTKEDGIAKMKEIVEKISAGIKDFIALIQDKGLFGAIGEKIGDAFKSMLTNTTVLTAVGGAIAALFAASAIKNALSSAVSGMFGGGGGDGGGKGGKGGKGGNAGAKMGRNVGGFVGGIAGGAMEGAAKGLAAFANPQILVGATILGLSITAIGAGIAGAAWLTGKALPTFVDGIKSFEELDGAAISSAASGMLDLSLAMAAFGAGTAVAGLGTLVGGITEGIGKLFGADDPLTKLEKFSAANIDAAKVKANAEAMVAFAEAQAAYGASAAGAGAGGAVGAIGDAIAGFFGGESGIPYEDIKTFQGYSFDTAKVKANAEAMVAFSQAMAAQGAAAGKSGAGNAIGAIGNAIASFFGGDTPFEQIQEFGAMDINAEGVKNNADAMATMATALSNFSGTTVDELPDIPKALVSRLSEFAAITGTGLSTTATGLTALASVPGLSKMVSDLNSLDKDSVINYNKALEDLVDTLGELNTVLAEDNKGMLGGGTGVAAADALGSIQSSSAGSSQQLNQLNTTMQQVLATLQEQLDIEKGTMKATKGLNGNLIPGT